MRNSFEAAKDRMASLIQRRGGKGSLLRGTALLGAAEMGNRVTRILTAIILARALTTAEFGMMALILATYEFVRMLIHNGLGARIIQAGEDEFDEVCTVVNRVSWTIGVIMCAVQMAVAWPVQIWFHADVAPMLAVLGVVHLIYPIGLVHSCIAERDQKYEYSAGMLFFQISMDNIGTAAMAFAGFGVWAAVVPKVLIAIIWVAISRLRLRGWRHSPVSREKAWQVLRYGWCVFAAESMNIVRGSFDKFIVAKFLGLEAFGVYAFAQNTGSGIANGLSTALGQAVLPYISRGADKADVRARFKASLTAMSLVIMPIVVLQVSLANWYVPIVYGEHWKPAIPTLMLMCLGMLSRPMVVATSQLLRATGNVGLEWRISATNTVLFVVALIGGVPYGVEGVAACLSAITILPAIFFARMALQHVNKTQQAPSGLAEAIA